MPTFQEVIRGIPGLTHYYPLDDVNQAKDVIGTAHGKVNGNVTFAPAGATFDGKSSIELPDHNDFSVAGVASKAITIVAFQTVTDWTKQSANNEYVHWMGKGRAGAHEWTFRYYIDGGSGEAASRPRRTSFYHFNPAGGLGAGSYFQDPDPAGTERVIGGMVWGNSSNGGSTQMWKNGAIRDTDLLSGYGVNPVNTNAPVFLGSRGDGTGFLVGRLRRVAFFNRRLTEAEMKSIYEARGLVEGNEPVAPPKPPPTQFGDVTIGNETWPIAGVNVDRPADSLIVYTPEYGAKTNTNEWGAEAAVVADKVSARIDQREQAVDAKNISIPAEGVVLSGHGAARTWLLANATVGSGVILPPGIIPEPELPAPDFTEEVVEIRAKAAELRVIADDLDKIASDIEAEASA